jgi:nucleotide-binding universal stress UspA family protein
MFPLGKILLPLDFSERCLGATRYAEALASHFESEISIVHVIEPLRYHFGTLEGGVAAPGDLMENLQAQARNYLDCFTCGGLERVRVKRILLEGDPAQRIVEYAQEQQVDLIAMPTHGYGPFRRFILGSVTAKVLHDADCPVLTGVHMEQAPPVDSLAFRTIVCAVDLGPQSRKALCWAAHMAQAFGARLALVHAVPCIESRPGEYFDRELVADISKGARQELEKLNEELHAGAEIHVEGGDPPKVVCSATERLNADLLVIARGSAAGISGRLRTNAYAIIRGSPCGVVSV